MEKQFVGLKNISTEDLVALQEAIDEELNARMEKLSEKLTIELAAELKKVLRGGYGIYISDGVNGDIELVPESADKLGLRVFYIPSGI